MIGPRFGGMSLLPYLAVFPVAAETGPVLGVLESLVEVRTPRTLLGHVEPALPVILMSPPTPADEKTRSEPPDPRRSEADGHGGLYATSAIRTRLGASTFINRKRPKSWSRDYHHGGACTVPSTAVAQDQKGLPKNKTSTTGARQGGQQPRRDPQPSTNDDRPVLSCPPPLPSRDRTLSNPRSKPGLAGLDHGPPTCTNHLTCSPCSSPCRTHSRRARPSARPRRGARSAPSPARRAPCLLPPRRPPRRSSSCRCEVW